MNLDQLEARARGTEGPDDFGPITKDDVLRLVAVARAGIKWLAIVDGQIDGRSARMIPQSRALCEALDAFEETS